MRLIITSGQMPLAHAAFMGIGAYVSAILARSLGWPVWLTIPFGALVATGVGIFIAYPFARLRAMYYAMVSLFFGTGILGLVVVLSKWTNGESGLSGIPPLFVASSKLPFYYLILGLTIICLLILYRLEFSRIGTSWKAIDQSYMVASSIGINEGLYRIAVLGVGCFFAGLAGAIYAHYNMVLSPSSFNMLATLWIVMYVLIGGLGNFAGPIIGTSLLIIVPEAFRGLKEFAPYISAFVLFIVIFIIPQGLVSLPGMIWSRIKEPRKLKRADYVS